MPRLTDSHQGADLRSRRAGQNLTSGWDWRKRGNLVERNDRLVEFRCQEDQ
jgi:hypothetical protein